MKTRTDGVGLLTSLGMLLGSFVHVHSLRFVMPPPLRRSVGSGQRPIARPDRVELDATEQERQRDLENCVQNVMKTCLSPLLTTRAPTC